MADLVETILTWIGGHEEALGILAGSSLGLLLVTALAVPAAVCRLPEDYFLPGRRDPRRRRARHPVLWVLVIVAKNLLGGILVAAGLAMLLLPGQGILTLLVGVAMINFPGKYRLERAFIRWPAVHRPLNAIRARAGCPPLRIPSRRQDGETAPS